MATYTTWLPVEPGADVWDLIAAPHQQLRALHASFAAAGLDGALLERCRARITGLVTGGPSDPGDAPTSEAERVAVDFAEQFVLDPRGLTDAQVGDLHRVFPAPQLAALTTAVATFDAVSRVQAVLADPSGTPASIAVPFEQED